jgi:hypothetical protein
MGVAFAQGSSARQHGESLAVPLRVSGRPRAGHQQDLENSLDTTNKITFGNLKKNCIQTIGYLKLVQMGY